MGKIFSANIKVIHGNSQFTIECEETENILEALLRQDFYFSTSCGGKGTCGKCKLQLLEGKLHISTEDRVLLTNQELDNGYRLSCKAYPKEDCTIRIESSDESEFEIISDNHSPSDNQSQSDKQSPTDILSPTDKHSTSEYQTKSIYTSGLERATEAIEQYYGIAIDIGTTTIVVGLTGMATKRIQQTFTTINKQRVYGADVISRIQASNEGKKNSLQNLIRKDLLEGIKEVVNKAKIDKQMVRRITIAGNTTMEHLLLGYSCETMGRFPFTPVDIGTKVINFKEIFASDYLDIPVTILPVISTFVGADIVAGLTFCNFDRNEKICMLIDLGTNGEMAIGNKDRILVSSTAAGPAFEGGNISCGVGSIAGAICNLSIENNILHYQTINDQSPIGLCGTGVIEITSELLKSGFIDSTGLLVREYFESGYEVVSSIIKFTQKDIREIQLAKAAVRAGIEILINSYGTSYQQLDTVYLAGGFGYKINIEKAIHIGLLPKELSGKIKVIGNSSLAGTVQYLTEKDTIDRMEKIIKVSEEINLSNEKGFNELYVDYMDFY